MEKNNKFNVRKKINDKEEINERNPGVNCYCINLNFILFLTALFLLLTIIFSPGFLSAQSYSRGFVAYTQDAGISGVIGDVKFPFGFDRAQCGAGQDFVLQVSPTGCIPSVVRSDLLEEQNVPVFCPIVATQLNPLISVDAINSISFSGEVPREASGIGYYPARAAVRGFGGAQLQQPVFNNVGYAVIVLKQNRNESAMPGFVSGNLTARITYDVKNAFGVGQHVFYLPELTEEEWNQNYKEYVFWNGRGFLRAEAISDSGATISIYSDRETYGFSKTPEKRRVATANLDLEQNRKSRDIYMPGFDSCLGSLQLELKGLENPTTTARLNLNGDYIEFKEGEKFIENRCQVRTIEKLGVVERAVISCREDTGSETFELELSPRIELEVNGETKEFSVGDRLYRETRDGRETDRSVYLVYVSTKKDSFAEDDLKVYVATIPGIADRLSSEDLASIGRFLRNDPSVNPDEPSNFWSIGLDVLKSFASAGETVLRGIIDGEAFRSIEFSEEKDVFGKKVKLTGYADAVDADLSEFSSEFKNYYENSLKDYDAILESFSGERYPTEEQRTLGEQALYNKIGLMWAARQSRTVVELCKEFNDKYPISSPPSICEQTYKLSGDSIVYNDVVISGKSYRIFLDRIREPRFEEFGAKISVTMPRGEKRNYDLRKNQRVYLNEAENEYIELADLSQDSARLNINVKAVDTGGAILNFFNTGSRTLEKNFPQNYNSRYLLALEDVNLKKVAKISVNPEINYARTNATFGFKIGIEKRAFKLSPEVTKDIIGKLDSTINTLKGFNGNLGNVVRGLNYACLATGTTLTVKNFFQNAVGEGIARQKVMRGAGGWFDKCGASVSRGEYSNVDSCLLDNNAEIENAVDEYVKVIEEQNQKFKNLQEGITSSKFLGEGVVDTKKLMERYIDSTYKNQLRQSLQQAGIQSVKVSGVDIPAENIIGNMTSSNVYLTQARDLELNARLLSSSDATIKEIASKQIAAGLTDVYLNTRAESLRTTFEQSSGNDVNNPRADVYALKESKEGIYRGSTAKTGNRFGIAADMPVQLIIFNNREYTLELEGVAVDSYRIKNIYDSGARKLDAEDATFREITRLISVFRKLDRTSYQTSCINCKVRYYESGKYKGLAAIVPFSVPGLGSGWYVATKPVVPIGGALEPFTDSGRATNFYVCNVGSDGKEEFNSGVGNDICRGFVYKASQPVDFPGLDAGEATTLKNRAEAALEDAASKYRAGIKRVDILGETFDVGDPATGVPDIQCQDFMSAVDCNILFNVCDPVVCPSSRCNLGGTYNVENVIQSGVAGSLALCLPNFPEVKVPICLSGVHAGIDSYVSVLDSYKSCLQTSLDTGQTIGICDEVHSVYMCELLWRQGLPVVNYAAPKLIGSIFGQGGSNGGGEYLGFQDAWKKAEDSVSFFTDYYAKNSFAAFKARSADTVGTAICRNWVSITSPQGGKIFDAITSPASPPQFYGRFDEIPFTSATVTPISQYKVTYHIYAGKQQPAYYQIYLRTTGGESSSFYQDIPFRRIVDTGYISAGQYASQTRDFTAPAGYKEMCIVVNNQEECGFKQVTSDFGINYITELYAADQASNKQVTSEAECISGTSNLYALLNPNLQSGAEEAIDPAIYNRGITRVCATDNPGKGTDNLAGTNQSRWLEVGYCGNTRIKCWLDTQSVKKVIASAEIEKEVIGDAAENYLEILKKEQGYVENFKELVQNITEEENLLKKIELVNGNFAKVFFNHEKGYLSLLRGNAFKELAMKLLGEIKQKKSDTESFASIYGSPVFQFKYGGFAGLVGKSSIYYKYKGIGATSTGNCIKSAATGKIFNFNEMIKDSASLNKWCNENGGTQVCEVIQSTEEQCIKSATGKTFNVNDLISTFKTQDDLQKWCSENGGIEVCDADSTGKFTGLKNDAITKCEPTSAFTQLKESTFVSCNPASWQWSLTGDANENNWKDAAVSPQLSNAEINSLTLNLGKTISYVEGLKILMDAKDRNVGSGAELSTQYVSYNIDNEKSFLVQISSAPDFISFNYDNSEKKWQWSRLYKWKRPLSRINVPEIPQEYRPIDSEIERIIKNLAGQNFQDGAALIFDYKYTAEVQTGLCSNEQECQKVIGNEIIKLAREFKSQNGLNTEESDELIRQQTGARNFECLILQQAMHESGLRHCKDIRDSSGNPLYCNGNIGSVLKSSGDEQSYGVMQVNKKYYGEKPAFEDNIKTGMKILIDGYNQQPRTYVCNGKSYVNWTRALRQYNGWPQTDNIDCSTGGKNYVENVINRRTAVESLFPETCGAEAATTTLPASSIPSDALLPIKLRIVQKDALIGAGWLANDRVYEWNGTAWDFKLKGELASKYNLATYEGGLRFINDTILLNVYPEGMFDSLEIGCGDVQQTQGTERLVLALETDVKSINIINSIKEASVSLCKYKTSETEISTEEEQTTTDEEEPETEVCPVSQSPTFSQEVLGVTQAGNRIIRAAAELNGKDAYGANCFVPVETVYKNAGVDFSCVYHDYVGKQYTIDGETVTIGADRNSKGEIIHAVSATRETCFIKNNITYEEKLNTIAPGDQLDLVWSPEFGHSVIFISWIDKANKKAYIFDWLGGTKEDRKYRYAEIYLTEDDTPVYAHRRPVILSA